jgi:hypothetical protein
MKAIVQQRMVAVTAALAVAALARASGADEPPKPASIASAFASTTVRFEAVPDERDIPVEWSYVNRWDFPLVVESMSESCSCLSGRAGQIEYEAVEPGESGRIRASFTPGPYRGLVRKSLHVRFAGHKGAVELVAEARIPSAVELSDNDLTWTRSAQAAARSVDVIAGTGVGFRITGLTGVPPDQYRIERETVIEGLHYRLTATPAESVSDGVKTLLIRTDSPDPRDQVKAVFLTMKPASQAPGGHPSSPPSPPDR